jgi:hypothetical protein
VIAGARYPAFVEQAGRLLPLGQPPDGAVCSCFGAWGFPARSHHLTRVEHRHAAALQSPQIFTCARGRAVAMQAEARSVTPPSAYTDPDGDLNVAVSRKPANPTVLGILPAMSCAFVHGGHQNSTVWQRVQMY